MPHHRTGCGKSALCRLALDRFRARIAEAAAELSVAEAPQRAALQVNRDVVSAAEANPDQRRMGAAVVLATVSGNRVTVGHAGDSRAYRLHRGRLSRLTRDHSLVERMLAHRILTADEARVHPDAHVVTHWLGQRRSFVFDIPLGWG